MSFVVEQLRAPRGLVMSFEELEQFAARINQVIWGEFIAAETTGQLPTRDARPDEIGRTALAGALAFDSSYWFVGGPSEVIDRAVERFEQVEEVVPEEWPALD